jgi:diguanylate cyclase (GGDEF)-like protein/PAS domain S-box-containing protein
VLEETQLRLWRMIFRARTSAFSTAALAAAVIPELGPHRLWFALGVLALVPYNVAFARHTERTRRLPRPVFFIDQLLGGLFVAVLPAAYIGVLLIMLADVALVTVSSNRRDARLAVVTGIASLAFAAWWRQPEAAMVGLVAYVVAAVTLMNTTGSMTEEERRARRRWGDLVDGLEAVVWEGRSLAGGATFVSRRAEALLGYPTDDWLTDPGFWISKVHPDDRTRVLAQVRAAEAAGANHDIEYRMLHADGKVVWVRSMVHMRTDERGRVVRVSGVTIDVTAEKRAELALRHQATHDALTGLPNRVLLATELQRAIEEAAPDGDSVALVLMDLDQFKEVNDTLGHQVGDELLAHVGRRLTSLLRTGDVIARLGGDEFALVLTKEADREAVDGFLRRLHDALSESIDLPGISLRVTASMGVAIHPEHGLDPETLVRRADVAMYTAKRASGGHAFYDPDRDRSSVRRLALAGELRRGIDAGELVLHFQPKIDVLGRNVLGAEALVRWAHPEHGLLPPSEFVEMASMSGMIQPMTEAVLEMALAECRRWAAGGLDLSVAVNLSVLNLYDPATSALISDLLHEHRLPGNRLVVEVTESDVMEDPVRAAARLAELSDLGVRVAIDDFGTGYSSLSLLRQLPIHELKIDRSFVSGMATDESDAIIVQSIVDLSHNLGLRVVAEGVETAPILDRLLSLGCDEAQGYHIGRPLPGPQFDGWLERWGVSRRRVRPTDATARGR